MAMHCATCPARRGHTLVELVLTIAMLGIAAAVAIPSLRTIADRMSVRAATQDVVLGLWAARNVAAMRGDYASFVVDAQSGRLQVVTGGDTVFARELTLKRGVTVRATRDSITYAPSGVGFGAANTTIILSRGRRADTVVTSRLGRVSYR
ncbi:MAG TPA: GspH/FimT family pseudopilin [Gemmatimonadaceae bacterium]|nr:GspH/FimT family pseudopilin [Gemmatimonadaceae bacterium]